MPTSSTELKNSSSTQEQEELKKLSSNLGAGFGKKNADKVILGKSNETISLSDQHIKPTDSVYLKNCENCVFEITSMCTKIFIESCNDIKFNLAGKVITQTLELWKCKNVQGSISTCIQTLQVDMSHNVDIKYAKHEDFNRLVWSSCEDVFLAFDNHADNVLRTGATQMHQQNPTINKETDQFIVRLLPNKVTGKLQLLNELIVRLDNGFPTTEREARQFEERQEANLKALAKEILGKDIVLGKKKTEGPKLGRNDPCLCGSHKKYKKCCGTDAV